jgi:hypothetical protein
MLFNPRRRENVKVPLKQRRRVHKEVRRLLDGVESIVCHGSLKSLKRLLENKLSEIKKLAEKM